VPSPRTSPAFPLLTGSRSAGCNYLCVCVCVCVLTSSFQVDLAATQSIGNETPYDGMQLYAHITAAHKEKPPAQTLSFQKVGSAPPTELVEGM
jgi:hypothetical protein